MIPSNSRSLISPHSFFAATVGMFIGEDRIEFYSFINCTFCRFYTTFIRSGSICSIGCSGYSQSFLSRYPFVVHLIHFCTIDAGAFFFAALNA